MLLFAAAAMPSMATTATTAAAAAAAMDIAPRAATLRIHTSERVR